MSDPRLVKLSKLLSLMLRHQPDKFGLVLDPEGFVPLREVLEALHSARNDASESDVVAVVETIEPDKRRFMIVDGEIRANYGHSFAEKIAHEKVVPPAMLFHGTTDKAFEQIRQSGILPMARQYVHLTTDRKLAERVGGRRGRPLVLIVDAARASSEGVAFYRANEFFWLADRIPPQYVWLDPR